MISKILQSGKTQIQGTDEGVVVSPGSIDRWVKSSRPGDCLRYYEGDLATERVIGRSERSKDVNRLAEKIYGLYIGGCVHLVQKRLRSNVFGYIVVKKEAPKWSVRNRKYGMAWTDGKQKP